MPDGTWKREGPPVTMVSLDSARRWHPRERLIPCEADHTHIAKLKPGGSGIYPSVKWAIIKAVLNAGDPYSEAPGYHFTSTLKPAIEHDKDAQAYSQNRIHESTTPLEERSYGTAVGLSDSRAGEELMGTLVNRKLKFRTRPLLEQHLQGSAPSTPDRRSLNG